MRRGGCPFFLVFVFVFFTDTRSRVYRWLGGLAHAGAHGFSMFWIGWGAMVVVHRLFPAWPVARLALGAVLVFAAGWMVGSMLMGLYLLVSRTSSGGTAGTRSRRCEPGLQTLSSASRRRRRHAHHLSRQDRAHSATLERPGGGAKRHAVTRRAGGTAPARAHRASDRPGALSRG